ncbi:transketolase [Silvimonas terrae]|uniref:Transketolase n=1 Tax=Silvimonas terrae TaxID=300266 RepID=A0A840RJC7_9NEIS|nr:transketolase [Silvimonas terrae]MBB5192352.1 transketolase [Silvimonas terrae]
MTALPELNPARLREIRLRLVQMHFESGVGHIGGNLSAMDAMAVLFREYIGAEDHFVLSKGHAAGALYIALWSVGRIADEQLKTFHKDNTLLPGHPPAHGIADIPFATGSLGHGLSLAAGTALGLRLQKKPGHVFCLMSDGEWQEGSTWEALIFACHQKLGNLTVLVDHNRLQGFGNTTDVASMAPLTERLAGFAAEIIPAPGHDLAAIRSALATPTNGRPRILVLDTTKGHGVSFMENRMEWHYLPLNPERYAQAREELSAR